VRAGANAAGLSNEDPLGLPDVPARLRGLLAQLDRRDGCLPGHSASVCALAVQVGRQLAVAADELEALALGSLLHDIGKVFIDGRVLARSTPLARSQREMIELHPSLGEALLAQTTTNPSVLAVVRWHHERWDGTGYPDRLAGDSTPLVARIAAVADAYTAMREPRAYRPALSRQESFDELGRRSWTQFDGRCVQALVESLTGRP
jgi:HD-GYP domain-containing protein (c-di-GMP phosphodiesterase class II)